MPEGRPDLLFCVRLLGSKRLSLGLVAIITVLCSIGALVPQESVHGAAAIDEWCREHSVIAPIATACGSFHVFRSWPFLFAVAVFAVNTLACTILHLLGRGAGAMGRLQKTGFLLLHAGIVGVLVGAAVSAGWSQDGRLLLTEGQTLNEAGPCYLSLAKGVFRKREHTGLALTLHNVVVDLEAADIHTGTRSTFDVREGAQLVASNTVVSINRPFTHRGLAFTQDSTGYSVQLIITRRTGGRPVFNSFIALQSSGDPGDAEHRDALRFHPGPGPHLLLTLYPDAERVENGYAKKSNVPGSPVLHVQVMDRNGRSVAEGFAPKGAESTIGNYVVHFTLLRRWSSLRVVDDPGYPVVFWSMWLVIIGLLVRYLPEVMQWLKTETTP